MENKNKQHTQLPNDMTATKQLKPGDLVVYLGLKKHYNSKTKECYPSLETLHDEVGASINTIRTSINNLIKAEYIKREKKGRGYNYSFSEYNSFEPFSEDFITDKKLKFNEKAYIAATQQYMYIESPSTGVVSLSDSELADKINLSEKSIKSYDKKLKDKGYLTIADQTARDLETGVTKKTKIFLLERLGQALVYTLKNQQKQLDIHTEQIEENSKNIYDLQKQIKVLTEVIAKQQIEIAESKGKNKEITMD